jgi:hypothetical protein
MKFKNDLEEKAYDVLDKAGLFDRYEDQLIELVWDSMKDISNYLKSKGLYDEPDLKETAANMLLADLKTALTSYEKVIK